MKNPDDDIWNRIQYEEKEPDPDKFTVGEITFWAVFFLGVLGGISVGVYKIISVWLELP